MTLHWGKNVNAICALLAGLLYDYVTLVACPAPLMRNPPGFMSMFRMTEEPERLKKTSGGDENVPDRPVLAGNHRCILRYSRPAECDLPVTGH